MFPLVFLRLLLMSSSGWSQFVPGPTDLTDAAGFANYRVRWKQVPTGTCELNPDVKSYSGFVDVASDKHMFFWFFETRHGDPTTAPLTVWIQGGPGSSMIGLFQELGPCGIDSKGKVYDNPYSWTEASNVIFIDQPALEGFSYSYPLSAYLDHSGAVLPVINNHCPPDDYKFGPCATYTSPNITDAENSTIASAPAFWATLQGFMGAFPQYNRKTFHLATESYGGHYGPVYSEYIEAQNAKNIPGAQEIHVETLLIGNGFFDPIAQYKSYYDFMVSPGNTYDYLPFSSDQATAMHVNLYDSGNCLDRLKSCAATGVNHICSDADGFCGAHTQAVIGLDLARDLYDLREMTPDPFPYDFFIRYLNLPDVQSAVGAFINFSAVNPTVDAAFHKTGDRGREAGTVAAVQRLVQTGVTVVLYAGDADIICNWFGVETVAHAVQAPGFDKAGYVDITTSDKIVHGQVKQSEGFSFARIYDR